MQEDIIKKEHKTNTKRSITNSNSTLKNKKSNQNLGTNEILVSAVDIKMSEEVSKNNNESIYSQLLIQMESLAKTNREIIESNRIMKQNVELMNVKHDSFVESHFKNTKKNDTNMSCSYNTNNNNNNNSRDEMEKMLNDLIVNKSPQNEKSINSSDNLMKCFVLNHAIASLSKF